MASGLLVYRQRLTAYRIVRSVLLGIYLLTTVLLLLDFARVTVLPLADIPSYFAASMVLGLMQSVLLLAAAQGIYFGPKTTYGAFLGDLAKHRGHAFLFGAFVALVTFVAVFANFLAPVAERVISDFAGNPVPSTAFDPGLLALIFGLFGFFLAYPTALMVFTSLKVRERQLRGALLGLGVAWAAVSEIYVITEALMWTFGVDVTGFMYLANALVFYAVIRNFRRSFSVAGLVEVPPPPPLQLSGGASGGAMSSLSATIAGKKVLYEVDPEATYEESLRKSLVELASSGNAVYLFTPRSSPLHGALTGAQWVKFFLTTSGVSYMKEGEGTNEILVPQSDAAVFLDIADRALKAVEGGVVMVFDSVTELLLMSGTEKTYKFLKQFLEILHESRSTGIFLFVTKAHTTRDVNLLRGIFPTQVAEDASGPRLVK